MIEISKEQKTEVLHKSEIAKGALNIALKACLDYVQFQNNLVPKDNQGDEAVYMIAALMAQMKFVEQAQTYLDTQFNATVATFGSFEEFKNG